MITEASGTTAYYFEALAIKDEEGTITYATGSANVEYSISWLEEEEEYEINYAISGLEDVQTFDEDDELIIENLDEDENNEEVTKLIIEALKLYHNEEIDEIIRDEIPF